MPIVCAAARIAELAAEVALAGFDLTVKNYRCFSDEDPLLLRVQDGLTAFVGPNNSGKSSCLRLFYELRSVFGVCANVKQLQTLTDGQKLGLSYQGVEDSAEIFHFHNGRPLQLQFDLQGSEVSRIVLTATPEEPTNWSGSVYAGPGHIKALAGIRVGDKDGFELPGGAQALLSPDFISQLADLSGHSMYVAAFRNAITEGAANYYDLAIGTNFIALWDDWKTGPNRSNARTAVHLTRELARIFGFEQLEISPTPGKHTLQLTVDNQVSRLRELGSGFSQFLVVMANVAMRRPQYLLIDEPELNLHPSLQADFVTALASYVPRGVLFSTHSVGLARTVADSIYSFQCVRNTASHVRPFEKTTNLSEFLGEMSYSTFRDLGFNRILLVEGVRDVKTVQQFLRALHKEHEVVLLPMGGEQLIHRGAELELAELQRLSKHVAVLIDSERDAAGAALTAKRQTFVDECLNLGYKVHVLERRALENYLTERAIRVVKGDDYQALLPYQRLKDLARPWSKSENWRIAREMQEGDLKGTDLGAFLQDL